MLQTIAWTGNAVRLIDQTRLPAESVYVEVTTDRQMWDAIRRLVVRGAPAIGVAAAYGVYLGIAGFRSADLLGFYTKLNDVADYLASSRPTAVNLFWALARIRRIARDAGRATSRLEPADAISTIKQRILTECNLMLEEDARACRAIGEKGLRLLSELLADDSAGRDRPISILTHCNAGALATVAWGTALAPVYVGAERGLAFHVWADETRPLLQGSRLTATELHEAGIPVTVICDSMAATVLRDGRIDAVIVGADRIAANGDAANKVGTLPLAIVARHYGVPFIVAAPTSTIDNTLHDGGQIPIEERPPEEITQGFGRRTAPEGVEVFNPAFDVTPAALITAIVTEREVLRPPFDSAKRAADQGTA